MKKALFYKEWIKTRYFIALFGVLSLSMMGYVILQMQRVIQFKGASHLWEILLSRDVVFTEMMQYVPLSVGLLLGLAQFFPEMQQKRMKLTLHLPYAQNKNIACMLLAGSMELLLLFLLHLLTLLLYLSSHLAWELTERILLTTLPWYLSGFMGYLLVSWVTIEPTWHFRIVNGLVSAALLRLFFLSPYPEAYNPSLPLLCLLIVLSATLPYLSVSRFKAGKQD